MWRFKLGADKDSEKMIILKGSTLCLLSPVSPEQDGVHGSDELRWLDWPDGGEDFLNPGVAP